MKNIIIYAILFLPTILFSQSTKEQKNILMVVSSYGKDNGSTRPGYEFDEFSQAYLVFKNNNFSVDVASPKGGKVTPDKFNIKKVYNERLSEDKEALSLLDNTMTTADVNPEDYDAIYIVGGKGAMFDLPFDPSLQDIVLNLYEREGTVISSVCHGPASLVNIKSNDEFIIKDVELTSFCNIEEELFGKKWVKEFPFSLETKLKERGAIFKEADFMLSKVVVSGKFVTGQNPFSTAKSAEAVVESFGITPIKRELYKDENSVYLIQDVLSNKITFQEAKSLLAKNTNKYDIPLIAVWGYYKTIAAKENKEELKKATEIMELTTSHFFDQNLEFVLARTHFYLGNNQKAKTILKNLISKNLLKEQAQKLLKEIK